MSKSTSQQGLEKLANDYLSRMDQSQKLREIANKKNYKSKLTALQTKISGELEFWNKKQYQSVERVVDLKKDLTFVESQLTSSDITKDRVDVLIAKYGL